MNIKDHIRIQFGRKPLYFSDGQFPPITDLNKLERMNVKYYYNDPANTRVEVKIRYYETSSSIYINSFEVFMANDHSDKLID